MRPLQDGDGCLTNTPHAGTSDRESISVASVQNAWHDEMHEAEGAHR